MNDASWAISALITAAMVIAAAQTSGVLAIGWLLLAVGMAGVTWVRFKARKGGD